MTVKPTAAVLALAVAVPVTAQAAATPTRVASAGTPDKKVCRAMEPPTGSHFPGKRVCRTKSEWTAVDAANEEAARALSDRASRNSSINQ